MRTTITIEASEMLPRDGDAEAIKEGLRTVVRERARAIRPNGPVYLMGDARDESREAWTGERVYNDPWVTVLVVKTRLVLHDDRAAA